MALFDVPGWALPQAPVSESSTTASNSRKRKRPDTDSIAEKKSRSAEANFEKIVKTLTGKTSSSSISKKEKKKGKDKDSKKSTLEDRKKLISHPMPLKTGAERRSESSSSLPPAKKVKTKHEKTASEESLVKPNKGKEKEDAQSNEGLTSLQKRMKESLEGARFRLGSLSQ